jgi:hypothetical protein
MTQYNIRVELDWENMQTAPHSSGDHDYEHPAIKVYTDGIHTLPSEVRKRIEACLIAALELENRG